MTISYSVRLIKPGSTIIHLGRTLSVAQVEDKKGDETKVIVTFDDGRSAQFCKFHSVQGTP